MPVRHWKAAAEKRTARHDVGVARGMGQFERCLLFYCFGRGRVNRAIGHYVNVDWKY